MALLRVLIAVAATMAFAPSAWAQAWLERPNAEDIEFFYPPAALASGIEGRVTIICIVNGDGRVRDCAVETETPLGHGFGAAAIQIASKFRAETTMASGQSLIGHRVRVPVRFSVAED